jgi:membrane-associated protease RseP (regulator of RpoE activity)
VASGAERVSATSIATFLAGGAIGLGLHESGHLLMASIFGADPGVKAVGFGPLPFFAITHPEVTPAREYAISAAGFWVQHASSEWLLTARPGLRQEQAPLAKGLLAFNVLASVAYASAAFGTFGPYERDTRAMADALGVDEPWVGAMILAPAALDTWRYLNPESRWAAWTSRALKVGAVLIVVRAAR